MKPVGVFTAEHTSREKDPNGNTDLEQMPIYAAGKRTDIKLYRKPLFQSKAKWDNRIETGSKGELCCPEREPTLPA